MAVAPIRPLNGDSGSGKLSRRLASADHVPTHKSSEPHVMYYELSDDMKIDKQQALERKREEGRQRTTSVGVRPSGMILFIIACLHAHIEINSIMLRWSDGNSCIEE